MFRSLRARAQARRSASTRVKEYYYDFEGAQGKELRAHLAPVRALVRSGEGVDRMEWRAIQYGGATMPLGSLTLTYGPVRLRVGVAGTMGCSAWTLDTLCACGGQIRALDNTRRTCRACHEDHGPWEGQFVAIPLNRTRDGRLIFTQFLSATSRHHVAALAEHELGRAHGVLETALYAGHLAEVVDKLVELNHTWRLPAWAMEAS